MRLMSNTSKRVQFIVSTATWSKAPLQSLSEDLDLMLSSRNARQAKS